MKKASNTFFYLLSLCLATTLYGCSDPNRVVDTNMVVTNQNWSYANKGKFDVTISDEKASYNFYFNVRVTTGYKYANMFVLISTSGPGLNKAAARYEVKLANPDGEWLGKGSGNLYSYQFPYAYNYKFPAKGTYHFEIEQNMRDNPLREVSDVGLRIEKAH